MTILKYQKELGGNRGKIVGITNDSSYHAMTKPFTGAIYLSKHPSVDTFKNNMSMAVRIFHELKHIVFFWNPDFKKLLKYSSQKREDYEHFLINKEISNILLNGTGTFGTGTTLRDLKKLYGW